MVGTQVSQETIDRIYQAIEVAKATGKVKKGTNEVTKAIERGKAKLVAVAKDVNPPEIVMHLPLLAKEKNIAIFEVTTRDELGAAAGIDVPTVAVAITEEGDAKKILAEILGHELPDEKKPHKEDKKKHKEQ